MAVGNIFGHIIREGRIGGHLHIPSGLAVVYQFPTQVGRSAVHFAEAQCLHMIAVGGKRHFHVVNVTEDVFVTTLEYQTPCCVGHIWEISDVIHMFMYRYYVVIFCNSRKSVAGAVIVVGDVAQNQWCVVV